MIHVNSGKSPKTSATQAVKGERLTKNPKSKDGTLRLLLARDNTFSWW